MAFLKVYIVGCIIAFILGCYDAYKRQSRGECIDDFAPAISVLTLMSWLYIFEFVRQKLQK